ncbi:spore germination protein [Evansella cellulosilytica]|uniref:GerA spore germination protein n=1 Tax=Evansella cellulosilytica (strain ATCC 21833 / DSM 2522 / FERM P-1141 / JCM 9156 / N-4) TaxID=649639 RepID=E6TYL1_EVAC2|nr:spore germination protein [Evansella cellulosilytica]ADU30061.1 GerA spore germination protein [Evansella cellulosilytica DSM 2522]
MDPVHDKVNQPISRNSRENEKNFTERVGIGTSFDVGIRKLYILDKEIQFYFVNGLCDIQYTIELLKELMYLDANEVKENNVREQIENRLTHVQVEHVKTVDDAIGQLLAGLIVIIVEGEPDAIIIDVRSYPGRGPEEPDTERVVRGSRDGYTENIIENTALTRRRIRDENLRNEIMRIGRRSKTDVCISYIDGVADPNLVEVIRKELENIDIDGLTMADKVVEEFVVKQGANPFPIVRYTERPDVAATHILEGHVIVIVDASPSVIIFPTTFFHHVQHAEEYRQAPLVGTFLRWVRFSGMLFSLFILPLWLLMVLEPGLLPDNLDYIGPDETTNVPVFAQIFVAELGIELLRMAAIHTPSPLATALGLVAALLIGEIAIEVGLLIPEVILYVAIGAIGMFATPSYELALALKMLRLVLLVLVGLFHAPGFVIGTTIFFVALACIRSLNVPYLWPFLPFYPVAALDVLIRQAMPIKRRRPSIVKPQDAVKQSNSN